ncbi:helix-turn-helix domain-containing protein [Streptomyces laurentii]|uniref:helix-turn-helix domain-containing protein n=1 Tax=Streptomyces laurentii TaxID=39478 RepID=UPI0036A898E2
MDSWNPSVRARRTSRGTRKKHSSEAGGVSHDNARLSECFTVIGNHLAQHGELSLVAIGLSAHIQSLPTGAPVDIKSLAARFPEGTVRIARALRELEAHGYLRRTRERTESGRMVTRTVSCNRPGGRRATEPEPEPEPEPDCDYAPGPGPDPDPGWADEPDAGHDEAAGRPVPPPEPQPTPEPPAPEPRTRQRPGPRRRALPDVPQPSWPLPPELLLAAAEILARLARKDPRLVLSGTDAEHLAPGVVAWLERDVSADAVVHALAHRLPYPLHRPAALLAHRLTANLPPPPPFRPVGAPRLPLQNCDRCDLAFRGAEPGTCPGCRHEETHGQLDS